MYVCTLFKKQDVPETTTTPRKEHEKAVKILAVAATTTMATAAAGISVAFVNFQRHFSSTAENRMNYLSFSTRFIFLIFYDSFFGVVVIVASSSSYYYYYRFISWPLYFISGFVLFFFLTVFPFFLFTSFFSPFLVVYVCCYVFCFGHHCHFGQANYILKTLL